MWSTKCAGNPQICRNGLKRVAGRATGVLAVLGGPDRRTAQAGKFESAGPHSQDILARGRVGRSLLDP